MGLSQFNNVEDLVIIPKRPAELNQHKQDEQNKVRGGITGEGQDLSMEDESRINDIIGDENDQNNHINQRDLIKKSTKQQNQGPLVRWERFFPVRSLKVLLVETDDSTRHVVCALLQNCGYEGRNLQNKGLVSVDNLYDMQLMKIKQNNVQHLSQ